MADRIYACLAENLALMIANGMGAAKDASTAVPARHRLDGRRQADEGPAGTGGRAALAACASRKAM